MFALFTSLLYASILEYGVIVWRLYLAKGQLRLLRVQNRFLSFDAFLLEIDHPQSDYSTVCTLLNIPTLTTRPIDVCFRFTHGLLEESLDTPTSIDFHIPTYTSRHNALLHIPLLTPSLMTTVIRSVLIALIMSLVHSNLSVTIYSLLSVNI